MENQVAAGTHDVPIAKDAAGKRLAAFERNRKSKVSRLKVAVRGGDQSTGFNEQMDRHAEKAGQFEGGGFADGAAAGEDVGDHRARDGGVAR